ncbi:MAG: hypothetical protein A3F16_05300 [Deltaproteobacteria bacterium RIFCSPHIGHO2_12_FULL_43_9]|nr:MAG: hypothetical protein A3F16_05300 [Deltaproteobacteria bacterium RIFCSPHIGHO2_12_FULL_43_9]
MKRLFGVNAAVLILSAVSTAIGGAFVLYSMGEKGREDLSIYSSIQQAMKARDEVSIVNKRMATIKKSLVSELRRGKVLERKNWDQFVLAKTKEPTVSDEIKIPAPVESQTDSLKKRLKQFDRKNSASLSDILNGIKKSISPYERQKKSLELLENRFIFVWAASSLKDDFYNQVVDMDSAGSGTFFVTVKNVKQKENGEKNYDLQLWSADGTGIHKTDKTISTDEWPFVEEARAEVGRLTERSSITSSFVTTDFAIAQEMARDNDTVEALVSTPPKKDDASSVDMGRFTVTPTPGSGSVGTLTPNLLESCIEPGPDRCIINVDDKKEKLDRNDPFNERRFEGSDFEFLT